MSSVSRVSVILLLTIFCLDCSFSASIPRNFDPRMGEEVILPKKRPFCNAFTGCGGKRAANPPSMPNMPIQDLRQRQFLDEDSFNPMMDSDNNIDDLSRQILSEAKLWEAIQEASAELARRKQKEFNGYQ